MKTVRIISALILIILGANMALAQKVEINQKQIEKIDSLFKSEFRANEPGVVFLLAQRGKILLRKAYGMANLELRVPMHPDHVLGIGSITKQFTAIAILLLQDQGKLSVKDDIHKYVPEFNTQGKVITIENLLSHTSGIPGSVEMQDYEQVYRQDINQYSGINFVNGKPLLFEPGTNWSYSNPAFGLCALIIERISNMSYADFVKKNIFEPLQMSNTCFGSEKVISGKTTGYAVRQGGFVVNEVGKDWEGPKAASFILSTVDDMLKWNEALGNNNLIKPETLNAAYTSFKLKDQSETNYGYGWTIYTVNQNKIIAHAGNISGYNAHQVNIPKQNIYFIAITNQAGPKATNASRKTTNILLNVVLPKTISIDSTKLVNFRGVYESPIAGIRLQSNYSKTPRFFYVSVEKGKIFVKRTAAPKIELKPTSESSFVDNNEAEYFFQRDDSGNVLSMVRKQLFAMGPIRTCKKLSPELPTPPKELPLDSMSAVKYAGIYKIEGISDRDFIVYKKGKLFYKSSVEAPEQAISFIGNDTFILKEDDQQTLQFVKDKRAKIVQFKFTTPLYDVVLSRVEVTFK